MNTNTNTQAWPTTSLLSQITTKTILITLLLVIWMVFIPWGTVHAADTAVKWHPGHYYAILSSRKDNPRYLKKIHRELKETPALRGIQVRYQWAELETAKGDYDFTAIDKHLAELAKQGKRLIILVQTKTFKPDTPLAPDYLKATKYGGGVFAFSDHGGKKDVIKGYKIKLWNDNVKYRLIRLMRALGEQYNLNPHFEGIGLDETAMGQSMTPVSRDQFNRFYENLLHVNKKMRQYFPNTMTFQFTNHPRPILKSFVAELKNMGTSLAGPDVRFEDKGLTVKDKPNTPDGVYSYYPKLSGIVPLLPSVMPNNFINTIRDGSGYEPTVQELLDFARDELKANYIFWSRTNNYYQKVLELLNYRAQTKDPAGGLDPNCPSMYPSCIE